MKEKEMSEIKRYIKERDEALESKDPNAFLAFVKKYVPLFGEKAYNELVEAREYYGDEALLLTMANMTANIEGISEETKKWYEDWRETAKEKTA